MTGLRCTSAFWVIALACFAMPGSLVADAVSSCVEEIGVPTAKPYIVSEVPASAEITFTVGDNGKPEAVAYVATSWLKFELQQVFIERGKYSPTCKGQRLTFQVVYEVRGEPTVHAESVTRFLPPNKFVVICHPVKGSVN